MSLPPVTVKPWWKSKKLWMSVLGVAAQVASATLGLPDSVVYAVGGTVLAYVLGESVVDAARAK